MQWRRPTSIEDVSPKKLTHDKKEGRMTSIKTITEKLNAWRRYRDAVRELSRLNDRELNDIGIRRGDIEFVVRQGIAA
jgi:uncharacterized protein YjiS (DUF1127 family)